MVLHKMNSPNEILSPLPCQQNNLVKGFTVSLPTIKLLASVTKIRSDRNCRIECYSKSTELTMFICPLLQFDHFNWDPDNRDVPLSGTIH